MNPAEFMLAVLRLAVIVLPAWWTARCLRRRFPVVAGSLGVLVEAALALSAVLLIAELLGVLSLARFGWLAAALVLVAAGSWGLSRNQPAQTRATGATTSTAGGRTSWICAAGAVAVTLGQWLFATANSLGGGMLGFDTLWYHMPVAARFAQSGSVTPILFTQADPFTAYYPANAAVFHAVGILTLGNDFLSPLLNLGWLALALLAAWCAGRRRGIEPLTLASGALLTALPVLGGTQPGQAFDDIAGLAALMTATALLLSEERATLITVTAGLALGIAAGAKYTFVLPAVVIVLGVAAVTAPGRRARTLGLIAVPALATGGLWYVRNLIDTANPLGLRFHLGPITLPGPSSPLATASQATVLSQIRHTELWGSRFLPGLAHAFGPLWPLMVGLALGASLAGLGLRRQPAVRIAALAAVVAGLSYLLFPTGATGLTQGSQLFTVNLRYATPALALALLILPQVTEQRLPSARPALGPVLLVLAVTAQIVPSIWLVQTGRHALFAVIAGVLVAAASVAAVTAARRRARTCLPRRPTALPTTAAGAALAIAAGAFMYAVQHHYFASRYLTVPGTGLGPIDRWAQSVSHTRIALDGTVEQYPLYGARDTNTVDDLGRPGPSGGYAPITSCRAWRATVNRGRYRYIVLTPGPTGSAPPAWTARAAPAALVLHPAPDEYVYQIGGRLDPDRCGAS
jgi:hypothetical protein